MNQVRRPRQGPQGLVLIVVMMAGVLAMVFLLGLLSRSRWPGPVHVPQATEVEALAASADEVITAWAEAQLKTGTPAHLSELAAAGAKTQAAWAEPLRTSDTMQWEHQGTGGRLRFRLVPFSVGPAKEADVHLHHDNQVFVMWEAVSADGKARKTGQALLQLDVAKKLQWTHM